MNGSPSPSASYALGDACDVSFVMPCLNEANSLAGCIAAIREALSAIGDRWGLSGEIVVADNGSTDGSLGIAAAQGVRVVSVAEKGYGAALRGGMDAARGRYLVMGDADGSYDFREAGPMIEALLDGAGLCMGSRSKGEIKPGAMPWLNRYLGNPVLSGLLNLLFRAGVSDAHCGLRALTRDCYDRLRLAGTGMEFASEMVIKAALRGEIIAERPITLWPDRRGRPPHLRPWRDGWRHLRYLFMLSPAWLFAVPAVSAMAAGSGILAVAGWRRLTAPHAPTFFGDYWVVLAGALVGLGHIAALLAVASHLYGVGAGYRRSGAAAARWGRWVTLESMILFGAGLGVSGLAVLVGVAAAWSARDFSRAASVLPAVCGTLLMTLGGQTILGGFLLAIVGGNAAKFLQPQPDRGARAAVGHSAAAFDPLHEEPAGGGKVGTP
jgi:hypothetical protein